MYIQRQAAPDLCMLFLLTQQDTFRFELIPHLLVHVQAYQYNIEVFGHLSLNCFFFFFFFFFFFLTVANAVVSKQTDLRFSVCRENKRGHRTSGNIRQDLDPGRFLSIYDNMSYACTMIVSI